MDGVGMASPASIGKWRNKDSAHWFQYPVEVLHISASGPLAAYCFKNLTYAEVCSDSSNALKQGAISGGVRWRDVDSRLGSSVWPAI